MVNPVSDRRADTRLTSPATDAIGITLRPGHAATLIDLGVAGARVHSTRPLRPGAHVHVQLTAESRRVGLGAEVLRCSVVLLAADAIVYSSALKFDHRSNLLWEEMSRHGYELPGEVRHLRHHRVPAHP